MRVKNTMSLLHAGDSTMPIVKSKIRVKVCFHTFTRIFVFEKLWV